MCAQEPRGLPVARLRPRDAGEQLVILRGKATDGARRLGRFAVVTTKAVAMIALCGAGVFLVGASQATYSRTPSYHFKPDRMFEDFKHNLDVLKREPKIDLSTQFKDIRFDRERISKWRLGAELPAPKQSRKLPAELPATSAP